MRRVVSLIPSATEILGGLLGENGGLVGVTHECDRPAWVKVLPKLIAPRDPGLMAQQPAVIDRAVAASIGSGQSLYTIDAELLARLEPDLVVTQRLCDVCTISADEVQAAIANLPKQPEVLELSPLFVDDVLEDIDRVGAAIAKSQAAAAWRRLLKLRLEQNALQTTNFPLPSVLVIEWTDPLWLAGHWVPEMIALAGGVPALGTAGNPSRRLDWEEARMSRPDVLLVACCGYDLEKNAELAAELKAKPGWRDLTAVKNNQVFAIDANTYCSRPGPSIIEGIELLTSILRGLDSAPGKFRRCA